VLRRIFLSNEQVVVKKQQYFADDLLMHLPACRTILCFFLASTALLLQSAPAFAAPGLADARAQWPFLADLMSDPDDLAGLGAIRVDPGSDENVVRSTTPGRLRGRC
jgi:hypothetical protein